MENSFAATKISSVYRDLSKSEECCREEPVLVSPTEPFDLNVTKSEIERGIQNSQFASTILQTFLQSQ